MPKIESKRVRVKDPVTGIWHDIPAIVSKESFLAAGRAAVSEAGAAQHALSAEESAQQAAASAAYNAQLPVVGAMEAARQSAAYANEAAENAASAISTAQGAVETAEDAADTAEDAAQKAQTAVQTATAAAVAAVPQAVTDWLDDNVTPVGSAVTVDKSLSIEDSAADAKAAGDAVTDLKSAITEIVDFNYIYNDTFSKTKSVSTGSYTNQNVVLTDKIPVQGGDVLTISYDIYATINPSIFSSILLQTIEYDANENVLKRTFSYDTPLTLLANTAKILFAITYSCSNDGAGYSETFEGYVKAQNGDATLNQDIHVPGLDYLLGIVGTDGQPW